MNAPRECEVCGTEHHAHQGHVFPAAVRPMVKPVGKTWRERDPEAYRKYMRGYMARRRAAARAA